MAEDYLVDQGAPLGMSPRHAPQFLDYVRALRGYLPPDPNRNFTYAAFGCGDGAGLFALAATLPNGTFFGIEPTDRALSLANTLGLANVKFVEKTVDQVSGADLPPLDYAIFSHQAARFDGNVGDALLTAIADSLANDGLLYVTYEALPGWAPIEALHRQARDFVAEMKAPDEIKGEAILSYLRYLRNGSVKFFSDNPDLLDYVDRLSAQDPEKVAERLLRQGAPARRFADMAKLLCAHGLEFAGSGDLYLNHPDLAVPPDVENLFSDFRDAVDFESHGDLVRNQFFRRDLYVKNGVTIGDEGSVNAISAIPFGAVCPATEFVREAKFGWQTVEFKAELFDHLIAHLCAGAVSVDGLMMREPFSLAPKGHVYAAVNYLAAAGQVRPMGAETMPIGVDVGAHFKLPPFNRVMLDQDIFGTRSVALIAPHARTALDVPVNDALMLDVLCTAEPDDRAQWLLKRLIDAGQDIKAGGTVVEQEALQLQILGPMISAFEETKLGKYLELGVIETA